MENERIERRAIIIGACIALLMAVAGWTAYYLSKAEVLQLDGNFSLIAAVATAAAAKITEIKKRRNQRFPFGQFVYEPLYTMGIGLLTVGVLISATVTNATKIAQYLNGERFSTIQGGVIAVYTIVMTVTCFGLAAFYRHTNRRLSNNSAILGAYAIQSRIDGFLSLGAGAGLILFSAVPASSSAGFLTQIGDAITVVVLCVLMINQPIGIIRRSLLEVMGSTTDDIATNDQVREIVETTIEPTYIRDLHVFKTGSTHTVLAMVDATYFDRPSSSIVAIKQTTTLALRNKFDEITFEIAVADPASDRHDANLAIQK